MMARDAVAKIYPTTTGSDDNAQQYCALCSQPPHYYVWHEAGEQCPTRNTNADMRGWPAPEPPAVPGAGMWRAPRWVEVGRD